MNIAEYELKQYRDKQDDQAFLWYLKAFMVTTAFLALMFWAGMARAESIDIDMDAIIQIESGGNPNAYNKHSGAIGLCQITPVVFEDYNIWRNECGKIYLSKKYLYVASMNKSIGNWYMNYRIPQLLKYYHIKDNIITRIACYNWGIGNVVKWHKRGAKFGQLPKETRNYILKYKRLTAERGRK